VPVTTNFMVTGHIKNQDYWRWAAELDVVANDHYLDGSLPDPQIELAFCADATRGMAGGRPWLLMEHSTSAVNWQPRNIAKQPGEMRRNSMQHVARGADAVLFFQWRASRAGAEKYHSGLLPHGGTETRLWREVVQLGQDLDRLAEVAGSVVPTAQVALLHDYPSWWGSELDAHPTADVQYLDQPLAYYGELWRRGVDVDVVSVDHPLDAYQVVVVPTLYMVTDEVQERIRSYVETGGTVLVTYFSGIVDEHDHVRLGGYPGAFRDVLGVRTEEFYPLHAGETVQLDDGTTASVWTELLHLTGAEAVRRFVDGPLAGVPAVTRHTYGAGTGWYVPTRLDPSGVSAVVEQVLTEAGVAPEVVAPQGVETLRRVGSEAGYLFVINHTADDADVEARGLDLLTGDAVEGTVRVPGGGVAVVRTSLPNESV
jgi:beta-galactosidase